MPYIKQKDAPVALINPDGSLVQGTAEELAENPAIVNEPGLFEIVGNVDGITEFLNYQTPS